MDSERGKLREQELALRDRIKVLDDAQNEQTIREIESGLRYFRMDDLEVGGPGKRMTVLCVSKVERAKTGIHLHGVRVWPAIPRLEFGPVGWTLAAIRIAQGNSRDDMAVISRDEFARQFESVVAALRSAVVAIEGSVRASRWPKRKEGEGRVNRY